MSIQLLTDIPFKLDARSLMSTVHLAPDSEDATEFKHLIRQAEHLAKPKALYRECHIQTKSEQTIVIRGILFQSRLLRKNLDTVERVFPFVATCGRELDDVRLPGDDFLKGFWWDTIKTALLECAIDHLVAHLDQHFQLGHAASMSPGSGDVNVWPIEEQKQLFQLFDGMTDTIGVELTDSCLMIPNKTVSGIRFPTETDFRTCQVCRRENCPSRRAVFDASLHASASQK